jgi:hypothetical protein
MVAVGAEAGMSAGFDSGYPVRFSVDYPDAGLNRVSTLLRLLYVIPVLVLAGLVSGEVAAFWSDDETWSTTMGAGGVLFIPTVLMLLVRQKYPRWWFDWNIELLRFVNRVWAYLFLLRDEYPSTDEEQAVHLEMPYPDAQRDLNRWLPLVKWFLAIPHYIALFVLFVGVFFAVIISWFVIRFTGKYPSGLFGFVVDAMRWEIRVAAYAFLLTTDAYPPFRLGQ